MRSCFFTFNFQKPSNIGFLRKHEKGLLQGVTREKYPVSVKFCKYPFVCVHIRVPCRMCGGQRTTQRNWFSSSSLRISCRAYDGKGIHQREDTFGAAWRSQELQMCRSILICRFEMFSFHTVVLCEAPGHGIMQWWAQSCPGRASPFRQFTYCVQTGTRTPAKVTTWIFAFPILRFLFNPTDNLQVFV